MKYETIRSNPLAALMYLERYVNKGSPSGFLAEYATSAATTPASLLPFFDLPLLSVPNEHLTSYQPDLLPDILRGPDRTHALYPCHPDIVDLIVQLIPTRVHVARTTRVIPTASARTVYAVESSVYIKLHYPHMIGRFSRANPWPKWISGFENSQELSRAIAAQLAPPDFAMLRERSGMLVGRGSNAAVGAGCIIREELPFPVGHGLLIPFFSLFSTDRFAPADAPLLVQLLRDWDSPMDRAMDLLIDPLLRCFKFQAIDLGLLPENNAQNLLFEYSQEDSKARIVHRDMMGTFKDLAMRRTQGLHTALNPYHSVDLAADSAECHRRRSFCYDFKMGEYVFSEIESVLVSYFEVSSTAFRDAVKQAFHQIVTREVEEYFGSPNTWWGYAPVLPEGGRPYIEQADPKYR